jgi:hypothetical protein
MTRKKRRPKSIDVRAILEKPIGALGGGRQICAYEASMRRAAEEAAAGKMRSAKRFVGALISYGLINIPEQEDDHRYVICVPKEWDYGEWLAMFDKYGPPPWRGEHDGLMPADRWQDRFGRRPKPLRNAKPRRG